MIHRAAAVFAFLCAAVLACCACGGGGSSGSPTAGAPTVVAGLASASPAGQAAAAGRAVVLGGGGTTGYAWEIGLIAGLKVQGVDLATADLFSGTSAGASVASFLALGHDMAADYAKAQEPPGPPLPGPPRTADDNAYLIATNALWQGPGSSSAQTRTAVGARALNTPNPIPESTWIALYPPLLGGTDWPAKDTLRISAVDVADGSVKYFGKGDGGELDVAVAASSAIPGLVAPITASGHRYMDGGVSGANVDVAIGYKTVIAILPHLQNAAAAIAAIGARGGTVLTITPDSASSLAMGSNPLDITKEADSARAGYAQAVSVAAALKALWSQPAGTRP